MTHPFNFLVQDNGELTLGARQTCANAIAHFAGKKIRIKIEEAKEKRSLQANDYYWGVIIPHVRKFRMEMGDPVTLDQVHEDLLAEFSPRTFTRLLNDTYEEPVGSRPLRSKEMNVEQFQIYITAITACMANMGAPIPTNF